MGALFDPSAFGQAVRGCAAALGMSVREAASDAEVSPATLNRIQRGKPPDVENYLRLKRWLDFHHWPDSTTPPRS